MKVQRRMSAVDLFCGAGGLTYGLRRQGITVRAGIDIDPACRYPFEKNNNARFIEKDVALLKPHELRALFKPNTIRVLVGCAPCQPFSSFSHGRRKRRDHRWPMLDVFCDLIVATKPEVVSMENVIELDTRTIYRRFVRRLRKVGYYVTSYRVRCADYGMPQKRRRLVVFASRLGEIKLIAPRKHTKRATVQDAIGDLPAVGAGETNTRDPLHRAPMLSELNMRRMQASRPGGFWREWDKDLRAKCHRKKGGRSFRSVYSRMSWHEPSPTITTQSFKFGTGRFGHPEQDRAITLREAAILQTFPRKYSFVPAGDDVHFQSIGRLIGNAVPVKLGEVIAKSILEHLRGTLGTQLKNRRLEISPRGAGISAKRTQCRQ